MKNLFFINILDNTKHQNEKQTKSKHAKEGNQNIFPKFIPDQETFLKVFHDLTNPKKVCFYKEGYNLLNENEKIKKESKFSIYFVRDVIAARTFGILCLCFFRGEIEFNSHIIGIILSLNDDLSIEILMDDGIEPNILHERYNRLLICLKENCGNFNFSECEIEFTINHSHKNSKIDLKEAREVSKLIPSFETCINKFGFAKLSADIEPPPFNYEIATIHKLSRKQIRERSRHKEEEERKRKELDNRQHINEVNQM